MLISTKGRYALRVLLELAEHNDGSYMTLMDIAGRQEISEKYLESIIGILSRAGYVKAVRGRGGGYKLARPAESYTVGSILKLTEGSLASVSCLGTEQNGCSRAGQCKMASYSPVQPARWTDSPGRRIPLAVISFSTNRR